MSKKESSGRQTNKKRKNTEYSAVKKYPVTAEFRY